MQLWHYLILSYATTEPRDVHYTYANVAMHPNLQCSTKHRQNVQNRIHSSCAKIYICKINYLQFPYIYKLATKNITVQAIRFVCKNLPRINYKYTLMLLSNNLPLFLSCMPYRCLTIQTTGCGVLHNYNA